MSGNDVVEIYEKNSLGSLGRTIPHVPCPAMMYSLPEATDTTRMLPVPASATKIALPARTRAQAGQDTPVIGAPFTSNGARLPPAQTAVQSDGDVGGCVD